jgi:GNAT superfamily N-acetyltransferase
MTAAPLPPPLTVRQLDATQTRALRTALTGVLVDCVNGGASVSFMAPLAEAKATAFWDGVADAVAAGDKHLFVAEQGGRLVGTVTLVVGLPENQPHRGEISKMLVLTAARNAGVGTALMRAAEAEAVNRGKTLLVLDTASPEAERLYVAMGWTRCGVIPQFALLPDGRPCDTVFYYKSL